MGGRFRDCQVRSRAARDEFHSLRASGMVPHQIAPPTSYIVQSNMPPAWTFQVTSANVDASGPDDPYQIRLLISAEPIHDRVYVVLLSANQVQYCCWRISALTVALLPTSAFLSTNQYDQSSQVTDPVREYSVLARASASPYQHLSAQSCLALP